MTPEREEMAQAIKRYLKLGLAVMPIAPREKLPVGPWEQHAKERPTAKQWTEWWGQYPECNVACVYQSSAAPEGRQLIAVDTDTEEAEAWVCAQIPLPPTPTAKTVKGRHRYYYAPTGLYHTPAKDGRPEFRAGVHFTVLPPSIHPSGVAYEWEYGLTFGEVTPADLPAWGVQWMVKREEKEQGVQTLPMNGTPYGLEALRRETEELAAAPEHTRNDKLNTAAFCLGQLIAGGQLSEADVAAALRAACERNGWIPQWGDTAFVGTLRSGLEAGKREPRAPEPRRSQERPSEATHAPATASETECALAAAVNDCIPPYDPPASVATGFRPPIEYIERIFNYTEERRNLPSGVYGLRSGWRSVDRHLGGFKWQQIIFVQAGTGVGKTTLMMHFAFATAEWLMRIGSDAVLLIKQLEGGIEQWKYGWAGYKYGVPLWAYYPGGQDRCTDAQHEAIQMAWEEWTRLPFVFSEERNGDKLLWEVEQVVAQRPVEAVLLDNVQLLSFDGNQYAGHKRVAGKAMDFCKETGIPFLVLSQVNEHKGQADSPRGGPEFKHNASCVLSVSRGEPGMKPEECRQSNITRVTNHKLRHSPYGMIPETRLCMDLESKRLMGEDEYALWMERKSGGAQAERERTPAEVWAGND